MITRHHLRDEEHDHADLCDGPIETGKEFYETLTFTVIVAAETDEDRADLDVLEYVQDYVEDELCDAWREHTSHTVRPWGMDEKYRIVRHRRRGNVVRAEVEVSHTETRSRDYREISAERRSYYY